MIDSRERLRLLSVARAALGARVRGGRPPELPPDLDLPPAGVFVTIHCDGALRGCLGTLDPREPLTEAVIRLAGDVAEHDHRFEPLTLAELAATALSLSILTPPELVRDPAEIMVGRDGLIAERDRQRGLLLPQVAVERGWDRETFLDQTCIKGGLPPDAWRHGAVIWRFEALVFGEDEDAPAIE